MYHVLNVLVKYPIAISFSGDKPNRYGHQRLYGALGWGIFSAATGFIIDANSAGQSTKNYVSAFYLAAAILLVDAVVSWNIKASLFSEKYLFHCKVPFYFSTSKARYRRAFLRMWADFSRTSQYSSSCCGASPSECAPV